MSLSDDIDRENGDLDWREYDAEGTNEATLAALDELPDPEDAWPLRPAVARELWMRGYVVVRKAHLKHVLDVYIENGMVEAEDEKAVESLWQEASRA